MALSASPPSGASKKAIWRHERYNIGRSCFCAVSHEASAGKALPLRRSCGGREHGAILPAMPDTALPRTPPLSAADHERAMSEYGQRAEARAHALGNRGPIRVGADGKLLPDDPRVLLDERLLRLPGRGRARGARRAARRRRRACCPARRSRPTRRSTSAAGAVVDGIIKPPYRWAKPLSDPVGGTDANNGRHPAEMLQPTLGEGGRPGRSSCSTATCT